MKMDPTASIATDIEYPESDGQPMGENTTQFRWIVTIKEGLQWMFRARDDVFVAGDLFWYPVQGSTEIRVAPDALVAFGRPPGDRGSYQQWVEGDIAPQVVFEVLSPGNSAAEMRGKRAFYERFGVEEYYIYDPFDNDLEGWRRTEAGLEPIPAMSGWTSPLLGIRFDWDEDGLRMIRPDGMPLETYQEIGERAEAAKLRAETAEQWAEAEKLRAEAEKLRAEAEKRRAETAERRAEEERRRAEIAEQRAEVEKLRAETAELRAEAEKRRAEAEKLRNARLLERLRALGIDPDA